MMSFGSRRKVLLTLVAAYAAGVVLRFLIGIFTSQNPFVMPDEALYANIARAIADGGGIALRNQPVTYTNILYPLLMSPVYALFGSGAQFRAIQLINCLFMNLAVFPAYGIAKRFKLEHRAALGIAVISLLLPDMLLTTRIMTEPIAYPLFLCTVWLMFGRLSGERNRYASAALTGVAAFLLTQAKSGSIALAVVFFGLLVFDFICSRSRNKLLYALVFALTYAALMLAVRFALELAGMDFSQPSIYDTHAQAPTLEHLKKTLPGLLLYAFFIPVAFGIYPLLLPASNLRRFDPPQRRMVLLCLIALALYAAGACYMFFDTETIGNYFAGRIHIRYVFMFLPVFLCFVFSPGLDGVRPNAKLVALLGFLLAMTVTVSFSALLSNRQYSVDAISLSYIIYDDTVLNWRLLSQIAAITFGGGMAAILHQSGWTKPAKRVLTVCIVLALATANWLGYDLNNHNNSQPLSSDARQAAELVSAGDTLLVASSELYFDNTLSVLDIAMTDTPYVMLYGDLCAALGDYGALMPQAPPQYWVENPVSAIPSSCVIVFTPDAFYRMVLAEGATTQYTDNGYYCVVTTSDTRRIFHSALTGLSADGQTGAASALYVYDELLLSQDTVRVYLKVRSQSAATLTLASGDTQLYYDLNAASDWICGDFPIGEGCAALRLSIWASSEETVIETYLVE
jgi:hypothetical protein